ncbi:uncharacterized protein LOC129235180 [Uloborus diversus]|uniref:uncharacterized protein LOC129235180 n=1 Tax=Uloborus diversus TaxID=327109 RepID=UPI00240A83AC|nr:uncharacterized protein LOC129235180 [Uloborus diversus]
MAKHALVTLAALIIATLCFVTPLILKYHIYKPNTISVASGDIVPVGEEISSVWCQGVELSSKSNFQSFLYEIEPGVVTNEFQRTVTTHKIVLPDKSQEYWRFHLLRGSQVSIDSCVRLFAGGLTVVKGHQGLHKCLKEHRYHIEREDISGEDSQSESESDDVTSSISSSQGAISNETDRIYVCKNALNHVTLPTSYRCNSLLGSLARKHILDQYIEETGYYYYIFASDTYLNIIPNEFSIQFQVDRTHYNYSASTDNCTSTNLCSLSIPLASDHKIIMQMDSENGTLSAEKLKISCKPREWLFCLFYAGFLITIFLCAFQ